MKSKCNKEYYDNGNVRYEDWLLNDKRHRKHGPASINYYYNGNVEHEQWFLNDKLHREDGPAHISYYEDGKIESEYWYLNNEHHRVGGPAYVYYYDNGKIEYEEWYLNDKEINPKDHLIEIPKGELDKLSVLRKFAFVNADNEYVFIKKWLKQDKEFYGKYKILF